MISIDKLKTLPQKTAIKKISLNLLGHEKGHFRLSSDTIESYFELLKSFDILDKKIINNLIERCRDSGRLQLITDYLSSFTSLSEPDWDWIMQDGAQDVSKRVVDDKYLVLDELRSPYNIGAIFRSAESFKIKKIFLLGSCASPLHPKSIRTSCGTVDSVEFENMGHSEFLSLLDSDFKNFEVFSLECGGENIKNYHFPSKGFCIIGNEEFGVSKILLQRSKAKVSIPTYGSKGSINVSVATGILLSSWSGF